MTKSYQQKNKESVQRTGKTLYERRIASAQARGKSRTEARGHGKNTPSEKQKRRIKEEKSKEVSYKATRVSKGRGQGSIVTVVGRQQGRASPRKIDISLTPEADKTYNRLLREHKPRAAKVFLLASQQGYGVPALAGAEWSEDFEDYYDSAEFELDYEYILE